MCTHTHGLLLLPAAKLKGMTRNRERAAVGQRVCAAVLSQLIIGWPWREGGGSVRSGVSLQIPHFQ